MSIERIELLTTRFGIIHQGADEIFQKGCTLHWKTDTRLVNLGNTFYRKDLDTYYLRSSVGSRATSDESYQFREAVHVEFERIRIDPRYENIHFSVRAPVGDINKIKIIPCENHLKSIPVDTFFTIQPFKSNLPMTISKNDEEDIHTFNISTNNDQFIQFKVHFWCWNLCRKHLFSNKRGSMRFVCRMSGPGVEDITVFTKINVQQNPGRGAKVTASTLPKSQLQDANIPSGGYPSALNWANTARMLPNGQVVSRYGQPNQVQRNHVNIVEYGRLMKINIELPKRFHEILGPELARTELENLKRDITQMTNNRVGDATRRRSIANDCLVKENMFLKDAMSKLHHSLAGAANQYDYLSRENNDLKRRNANLHNEVLAKRQCDRKTNTDGIDLDLNQN